MPSSADIGRDARAIHDTHQRPWPSSGGSRYYLRALASTAAAVGKRDLVAANLDVTLDNDGDPLSFTLFVATTDYIVLAITELEEEEKPDTEATIIPWRSLTSATFGAYRHHEDAQSFDDLTLEFSEDLTLTFSRSTDPSGTIDALADLVRTKLAG